MVVLAVVFAEALLNLLMVREAASFGSTTAARSIVDA
jgi:hypothetical protein